MKKLMVAAAVAMLGIAANAGAYVWGFSDGSIEDSSGNYIEGGTAMLFIGKGAQTGTTLDLSAIVESLVTTGAQNPDPDYNFGTFTVTTAKGDDQELHITGPLSDLVDNSKTQDYTLILFEESGVGTSADYMGNYYVVTGKSGLATDADSGELYSAFVYDGTILGGSWVDGKVTFTAVPEPTSGLLLLLGVAGLALRRRRA